MTTLTMQDEKRIEIIQRVFRGELTVLRAAVILGLSERQCYRIKRRDFTPVSSRRSYYSRERRWRNRVCYYARQG